MLKATNAKSFITALCSSLKMISFMSDPDAYRHVGKEEKADARIAESICPY